MHNYTTILKINIAYIKYTLLFTLFFVTLTTNAQFVNYGTDPANLKWNIAKTNHYKIIYPRGNDSMAFRYAVLLENSYPHIIKTIGIVKEYKFPVILHPTSMLSNGLVSWAPRRMEIIPTPSPNLYSQNWDKQLVLHESRHVIQTSKLMQGIFKPLYYIIGEQTIGVAAFAVPKWFFEGDAVCTETALSSSGRGRLPEFNMTYRAQLFSKNYSFDKWLLGSFKDYTGDFYALGYNLTAYARKNYGSNIWDKVINRYSKRVYAIPPFANALKHYTNLTPKKLFDSTFNYLYNEWKQQDSVFFSKNMSSTINYITPQKKSYTSYKYPQALNDSVLFALKECLTNINSIVCIENGIEKHVCYVGNINSKITLDNNKIYWSEYTSGLRWIHKNYSVIKFYDLKKKTIKTLTPKKRYLSSAIEHNGTRIAVSKYSEKGQNSLVLLDKQSGNLLREYKTPSNVFIKDIVFNTNGYITTSTISDKGINLMQLNTNNGEWKGLMKPTSSNIASLNLSDSKLYFESGLNGTNNIYYLDTLTLKTYQITTARFGAFYPSISPSGKHLLFSDYQANGYQIAKIFVDSLIIETADFDQSFQFPLAEIISKQENFNFDTVALQPIKFESKPYNRALNLFNIHSWAPFYYDVTNATKMSSDDFSTIIKPGATFMSQNALNTTITQVGWYYKKGYHHGKLSFTYMGWYPIINFNIDYGDKAFKIGWKKENEKVRIEQYVSNKNLVEADVQLYIPFNLTKSHYIKGFIPIVTYKYTNNRYQQLDNQKFRDFQYLLTELRYYNYRKRALRDILPRWGYQLRLQYLTLPFDTKNFGSLYLAQLTTYVPGLINNNGLMLRFGYQYQASENKTFYIPKQLIDEPRGYSYSYRTQQLFAFKADYSCNLFYPDFSVGSLAYIKRIRGNIFYDITANKTDDHKKWKSLSSFGGDLIFDLNALRLDCPLSFGLRFIKPINNGNLQIEALFFITFQ